MPLIVTYISLTRWSTVVMEAMTQFMEGEVTYILTFTREVHEYLSADRFFGDYIYIRAVRALKPISLWSQLGHSSGKVPNRTCL